MPNEPVRVVLISEVPIYRDGLRLLLDAQSGFTVVGAAASCGQAVEMTGAARPDVLVLDLGTPILPNPDELIAFARACASARIIVLVPALDNIEIIEALRHGVRGVVLKAATSDLLFRSIRAVAAGQVLGRT